MRHLAFYTLVIGFSLLLLFIIISFGPATVSSTVEPLGWFQSVQREFAQNLKAPLAGLLIQLVVILSFSRLCSIVLNRLGQPHVIGEMVAGILLGQSVFAYLWPAGFEAIFPESSMPRLYFLSQLGLVLFMFVVGLDLKLSELKNRASSAILISHASIIVPFLLGALTSLLIYEQYGPKDFSFSSFALFMGIAMSITAFPVLARIIQEKRMSESPLGVMALTCAAVDDITAWCVLAAIIGIVNAGTGAAALGILIASLCYVFFMLKALRPLLAKVLCSKDGTLSHGQLSIIFCIVFLSALTTELIGIHALFGAFLAGVIMPQNEYFRHGLVEKISSLSSVVLLPIFFAYTGLRMQIGFLETWHSWMICGLIIAMAIIGKMFGSAIAARWEGMSWRDSFAIGALMNTRGLMELVVLNIGHDIGVISAPIFAMMVLMALVTTAMTGPMLSWLKVAPKAV